jgi:hypothetical protein
MSKSRKNRTKAGKNDLLAGYFSEISRKSREKQG